ncbi:MAG: hypothetical protein ACOYMS_12295 [Terrimicrobiaceae bacterium]
MKEHSPAPKSGGHFVAFLILSAIAAAILLAGLVLGTEPRLFMERSPDGSFRVTGSNQFAGWQFFSKTIEGVRDVTTGDAVRDGRRDSVKENRRRRSQQHLAFSGNGGGRLRWDRESDSRVIGQFMQGTEPTLALADPPPLWRMAAAWFCVGLGGLAFVGAIQSSFFPKKNVASGRV